MRKIKDIYHNLTYPIGGNEVEDGISKERSAGDRVWYRNGD